MHVPGSDEAPAQLVDHLWIIYRHRKLALSGFLFAVIYSLYSTATTIPTYAAHVKLLLAQDESQPTDIIPLWHPGIDREFCQNLAEILRSQPVAAEVVRKLKLDQRSFRLPLMARLSALPWQIIGSIQNFFMPPPQGNFDPSIFFDFAVAGLQGSIDVHTITGSTVLVVSVEDPDPGMAQKIANTVADVCVERTQELRRGDARRAYEFLSARLVETERKLVAAEDSLRKFQTEKQAVRLDEQIKHLAEVQKFSIDDELAKVQQQLSEETARVASIADQLVKQKERVLTVQGSGGLSELKAKILDKKAALASTLESHTRDDPEVLKAQAEIDGLQKSLTAESTLSRGSNAIASDHISEGLEVLLNTSQQAIMVATSRQRVLQKQSDEYRARLQELLAQRARSAILQREVDSLQKVLETLLLKQKEVGLKEVMTSSPARVLEQAPMPRIPIRPRKFANFTASLVVGLLLGIGLAYLGHNLDNSVRTESEIARTIGVPVLGTMSNDLVGDSERGPLELVALRAPTSDLAEDFKVLRYSVQQQFPGDRARIIMITSSLPGEGKSTVTANLGISLSQAGERVLIVDADLRKSRQHNIFQLENKSGVGDLGSCSINDMLHRTSAPNLWVMPAGKITHDPTVLLEGPQLQGFLRAVRTKFDRILIDSPPVNLVSDSILLAAKADGVILVVGAGDVNLGTLTTALNRLRRGGAQLLGGVINKFTTKAFSYGYYGYRAKQMPGDGPAPTTTEASASGGEA